MGKYYLRVLGGFFFASHLAIFSKPANAASLVFVPDSQTVVIGNPVTVDIVVSNPEGTLVGAYDLFMNYGTRELTLTDVIFGGALGGSLNSFQESNESPAGTINVAETSLLTDLSIVQTGSDDVLLFSLVFDTEELGTSDLNFGTIILGDDGGQAITPDAVGTGSITVNPVPVPGAIWLLGSALLALIGFKQQTKRRYQ